MGNDRDRVLELTGAAAYQAGIAEGRRAAFEEAAKWHDRRAALAWGTAFTPPRGSRPELHRAEQKAHKASAAHFREQARKEKGDG